MTYGVCCFDPFQVLCAWNMSKLQQLDGTSNQRNTQITLPSQYYEATIKCTAIHSQVARKTTKMTSIHGTNQIHNHKVGKVNPIAVFQRNIFKMHNYYNMAKSCSNIYYILVTQRHSQLTSVCDNHMVSKSIALCTANKIALVQLSHAPANINIIIHQLIPSL